MIPLRVAPIYAGEIFKACCVLHNLMVALEDVVLDLNDEDIINNEGLDYEGLIHDDPRLRLINLLSN